MKCRQVRWWRVDRWCYDLQTGEMVTCGQIGLWRSWGYNTWNDNVHMSEMMACRQVRWWHADRRNAHTHTHTNSLFSGKPGLAGCPLDSQSHVIHILSILTGHAKTRYIFPVTIPPGGVPHSSLLSLFWDASLDQVSVILMFSLSNPL